MTSAAASSVALFTPMVVGVYARKTKFLHAPAKLLPPALLENY